MVLIIIISMEVDEKRVCRSDNQVLGISAAVNLCLKNISIPCKYAYNALSTLIMGYNMTSQRWRQT